MALTYSTLQTQIAGFLNRDDLTAQIPTFILMAEGAINRDLRHWQMEKRSEATFNTRYEPLPSDWLEAIRVSISGKKQLDLLSQAKMLKKRYANDNTSGEPTYYAMSGGQIEFFPTPDADYDGSMLYYARVPALSDAAPTNWLLQDGPDIYIYGSLIHSAPYLAEDERLAAWASLYADALASLNSRSLKASWGGTGLAIR